MHRGALVRSRMQHGAVAKAIPMFVGLSGHRQQPQRPNQLIGIHLIWATVKIVANHFSREGLFLLESCSKPCKTIRPPQKTIRWLMLVSSLLACSWSNLNRSVQRDLGHVTKAGPLGPGLTYFVNTCLSSAFCGINRQVSFAETWQVLLRQQSLSMAKVRTACLSNLFLQSSQQAKQTQPSKQTVSDQRNRCLH